MTLVSFFQDIQALVLSVIHFKSFEKDLGPVHMNTSVCQLIYTFQPLKRNEEGIKKGREMMTQIYNPEILRAVQCYENIIKIMFTSSILAIYMLYFTSNLYHYQ